MLSAKSKRYILINIEVVIISLVTGTLFLYSYCPKCIFDLKTMLVNSGYSIMLGAGLFHNGLTLRKWVGPYFSWLKHPGRSALIAVVTTLIYSSFVIFFTNWLWFVKVSGYPIEWLWKGTGKSIITSEFILLSITSGIVYARIFFAQWKQAIHEKEALKREALELQYQVLSHQVNPHFLFNSLNVLNSLIDVDPTAAKQFVVDLSMFYRELLSFKEKEIVEVAEEISFLNRYLKLQQKRFGNKMKFELDVEGVEGFLIPMTLQMLAENAIKHNVVSADKPLTFTIKYGGDGFLIAENNLQKKEASPESSFIGLNNLKERYQYMTGKEMIVSDSDGKFSVKIPLIYPEP